MPARNSLKDLISMYNKISKQKSNSKRVGPYIFIGSENYRQYEVKVITTEITGNVTNNIRWHR